MKKIVTLAMMLCFLAVGFEASAQMSKKEAKQWKKRIKSLQPQQYKNLIEENKSLKSQTASLKNELAGVDDKLADKDEQISTYQDQIATLRKQLSDAKTQQNNQPSQPSRPAADQGGIDENVGIVFKVQIGAYAKKDLTKYKDAKNFNQESADGLNKFTLGAFRDYWEADTFKKYLREMGVKDAFIVSYKDGQRVDIKEVLEGVSK